MEGHRTQLNSFAECWQVPFLGPSTFGAEEEGHPLPVFHLDWVREDP